MFFANLESIGQYKHGLKISFGLIFLFLALRYNYGNDYLNYHDIYELIGESTNLGSNSLNERIEYGWFILNLICQPIGFFGMTALLALLNCTIYYRFIKKYVPRKYYWLGIFLYIFTPEFMLIHASAMRQSLAIAIFIFSLDYIFKKDLIRYSICIIIASLFHFSALVLLSVYFLGVINQKINLKFIIVYISLLLFIFVNISFFGMYILQFIDDYFPKYSLYAGASKFEGTGFILSTLILLIIYYGKNQNVEKALLFKFVLISFLFIPLTQINDLIGRIGMYFSPAMIIVYPSILSEIKKSIPQFIFSALIIFLTLRGFYQFFLSEVWIKSFGEYQTIFSAPTFY